MMSPLACGRLWARDVAPKRGASIRAAKWRSTPPMCVPVQSRQQHASQMRLRDSVLVQERNSLKLSKAAVVRPTRPLG